MDKEKLMVVVLVLATIVAGLGLYLFRLDRRISRLYKQLNNNQEDTESQEK